MNFESRPLVVYPTFHDTQQQQQQSKVGKKEMDIDDSIYHLLSMYLDANTNIIIPPPPTTTTQSSRMIMIKHSPYFRSKRKIPSQQQNWLGEKKRSSTNNTICTELERNTIKNSYTIKVENDINVNIKTNNNKKARSKSVSFNETVTVINQDKKASCSDLIQPAFTNNSSDDIDNGDDDEEDLFVDALENFTE
ncbi:hypothetical protein INT46_004322 [Mucor plumbeus]|uniref:Uncharacterized protein n=1 Tax=Mucor plumbeus TaxID=97098 RepID=A0A8H7QLI4_9FUNG|nr:hypothetical protein INT46_004322 [Mucor plumbeus]